MKLEHIGIAVKDLATSIDLFEQLLNTPCYKQENVADQGVVTAFFATGDSKVELISSTSPESPIEKYINKRGEGLHHIAFEVENIEAEIRRLQALGFEMIDTAPRRGADNKMIAFMKPATTSGVLVELCMTIV